MELAVQTCVMINCLAADICVETIIVCLSALIVHLSESVVTNGWLADKCACISMKLLKYMTDYWVVDKLKLMLVELLKCVWWLPVDKCVNRLCSCLSLCGELLLTKHMLTTCWNVCCDCLLTCWQTNVNRFWSCWNVCDDCLELLTYVNRLWSCWSATIDLLTNTC